MSDELVIAVGKPRGVDRQMDEVRVGTYKYPPHFNVTLELEDWDTMSLPTLHLDPEQARAVAEALMEKADEIEATRAAENHKTSP